MSAKVKHAASFIVIPFYTNITFYTNIAIYTNNITIHTNITSYANITIAHGATPILITKDSHFKEIEGPTLLYWTKR